ncbi:MAG: response regulator [bacterium]
MAHQSYSSTMNLDDTMKKVKILLIDDDEWIRDSLSLFFENEGWHLRALETAEEGIELLKNQTFEVIITDYRLPGMDGLEFFKHIQGSHPNALKILITAYWNTEVVSEAEKIGIRDLIKKPFTTKTIEETLSRWMKDTRRQ